MNLTVSNTFQSYPFPSWNKKILEVINYSLRIAWDTVKNNQSNKLSSYDEELITYKLETEVQNIMNSGKIEGFDCSRFQNIVRGAKICDYRGISIEKAPDLTIRQISLNPGLMDEPQQDALFIECKIIDKNKPPLLYIDNGIRRFIDGEYGWAMPQSMMIAFVKNQQSFNHDLVKTFKRNKNKSSVKRCAPFKIYQLPDGLSFSSAHQRMWQHKKYGDPGNIEIIHLWLDC